MEIDIRGRGEGKTHDLIKLSAERNMTIVVCNRNRRNALLHQARHMGVRIPLPLTVQELHGLRGLRQKIGKVLVDDLEEVLYSALGVPVDKATMTGVKQI